MTPHHCAALAIAAIVLCESAEQQHASDSACPSVQIANDVDDEVGLMQIATLLKGAREATDIIKSNASKHNISAELSNRDERPMQNDTSLPSLATAMDVPQGNAVGMIEEAANATQRSADYKEEIVYELPRSMDPGKMYNKLTIAVLEGLGLGMLGIDRCCMGNTCLGFAKGFTFGGLGVWAMIDYIAILANMLSKDPSIDSLGFTGTWQPDTIDSGFIASIVFLAIAGCCCLCGGGGTLGYSKYASMNQPQAAPEFAGS